LLALASARAVFRQHARYVFEERGLLLWTERPDAQWTVRLSRLGADLFKARHAKNVLVVAHVNPPVFDGLEASVALWLYIRPFCGAPINAVEWQPKAVEVCVPPRRH